MASELAHAYSYRGCRRSWRALVVCGALLCAAGAQAAPNETQRETARTLMAKGREERSRGELTSALKSFFEADAIMRVPTTTLAVAETQADLGLFVEARQTLQQMAAAPADEREPFRRARERAAQLDQELARRLAHVQLELTPAPAGPVRVSIDGRLLVEQPPGAGYAINPGPHELTVEYRGRRAEQALVLVAGETRTVKLDVPLPLVSPRREGASGDAGSRAGSRFPASGTAQPTMPVFLLGGVAAGGLVSGITFGAVGRARKTSLESQCAPLCSQGSLNGVRNMYTFANISFAVSALSAIAASVTFLVSGDDEETASRATRPSSSTFTVSTENGEVSARLRRSF